MNSRPEVKQLPSFAEWLRILFWTCKQNRSELEQRMISAATTQHGRNLVVVAALTTIIVSASLLARSVGEQRHRGELANAWADALRKADVAEVPAFLREVSIVKADASPILRKHLTDENAEPRAKLNASLALLDRKSVV